VPFSQLGPCFVRRLKLFTLLCCLHVVPRCLWRSNSTTARLKHNPFSTKN
jgi:hypothetical protein